MVNSMRKSKSSKRKFAFLLTILLLIISYTFYRCFGFWKSIIKTKKETIELKSKYNDLLSEKEVLETDVKKLQDPDYVAKYAREKYLYSKDGELIIKIVDENE